MADEQIIYLSPEEELTNVRERLEGTTSRRIILVIPAQTQLRSHVSWRLLHTRARELNRDILIISADRQIRAVVKAAGFKVADSLESPPSSKSRSSSRQGRPGLGGKTSPRLRTPTGGAKIAPSAQSAGRQRGLPAYEPAHDESTLVRRQKQPAAAFDVDNGQSVDDGQDGNDFAYGIDSPPTHLHPFSSEIEDDDPNHVFEDYKQSQSIRRAAQHQDNDPPSSPRETRQGRAPAHATPPGAAKDSQAYLEDEPTDHLILPEQRGSAFVHDGQDSDSDIAGRAPDALQIEDQGDMGDIVDRSAAPSDSAVATPPVMEEEEDESDLPAKQGSGRRGPRRRSAPASPQTPVPEFDDETALPPVAETRTRADAAPAPPPTRQAGGQPASPAAQASPAVPVMGMRSPEPVELPTPRQGRRNTQPPPVKRRTPTSPVAAPGLAGAPGPIRRSDRPQASASGSRRRNRASLLLIGLVSLALLALVLLVILLPSADVTVFLTARTYSLPLALTASSVSRQDSARHTLPAQTLVYATSVQGTGRATGVTTVGTVAADGSVYFTNNNTAAQGQIDIPTGTTVATPKHILFTTQADVLVQPGQTMPTTILAQNPGSSGNVAAHTIVELPAQGASKISQSNPGVALNLKVDNTTSTAHGGTGKASEVTSQDAANIKNTLDIQVNAQLQSYLQKNVHVGDQLGTPARSEIATLSPAVGSVASNGTLLETLQVHVTILVVRSADLEAAAAAQMQNALAQQGSGLALVPGQGVQLKQLKNTPARDGNSLALSFTAVGQVAARVTADSVRSLMAGKTVDDARTTLDGKNGTPNVSNIIIVVHNGVLQLMPFLPQRIAVHFQTVQVPAAPAPAKH